MGQVWTVKLVTLVKFLFFLDPFSFNAYLYKCGSEPLQCCSPAQTLDNEERCLGL